MVFLKTVQLVQKGQLQNQNTWDDYVTTAVTEDCTVDYCYRLVMAVPRCFSEAVSGPEALNGKMQWNVKCQVCDKNE